jgi:hypothetical protein
MSIPVATRSKARVCGRSFVGIAGSNRAGCMDVCCDCCVLSGRGLCNKLITRAEKPTECGVSECDRETLIMRPRPARGCRAMEIQILRNSFPTHTQLKWTNLNNLTGAIRLEIVAENVALGQVSLPIFRLSLVTVIPPMLGTNTYSVFNVGFLHFIISQTQILLGDIRIFSPQSMKILSFSTQCRAVPCMFTEVSEEMQCACTGYSKMFTGASEEMQCACTGYSKIRHLDIVRVMLAVTAETLGHTYKFFRSAKTSTSIPKI